MIAALGNEHLQDEDKTVEENTRIREEEVKERGGRQYVTQ